MDDRPRAYKVLRNEDLDALQEDVTDHMRRGWRLRGPIVVSHFLQHVGELTEQSPIYIQVVVQGLLDE